MTFLQELSSELKQEAAVTRRYLEKVDFENSDFQPHEKSEKFGRLAIHVAELLMWWKSALQGNELNFKNFKPKEITTTEGLLEYFDTLLHETFKALRDFKEEDLTEIWTMKLGDEVLFKLNKKEVLRKFCMNHLIHHRAQLGVYLRILGVPVPATYGPSADDGSISLTEGFQFF